jgi:ribulose 1,5-bisphosphate carboxylase large subunit-like protein
MEQIDKSMHTHVIIVITRGTICAFHVQETSSLVSLLMMMKWWRLVGVFDEELWALVAGSCSVF